MNKALRFLLPDWARPENPILQYELAHAKQPASRRRTLADWRIGWLVIALLMTVSLLLPFTMIAVSGGIGLLISVAVKDRVYIVMAQVTLVLAQAALAVGTHLAVSQVLRGSLRLSDGALFALFLGYSGLGDWGLLFAQLGSLGEIWALVYPI